MTGTEGVLTGVEALGTVFTQVTTWMGTMADTITGEPVYLIGVGIFVVGSAIGLVRRLIMG